MIERTPPRPRYLVRCWSLNTIALGCGIPVAPQLIATTAFRWRWLARAWHWINERCPRAPGFAFWSEIERERPRLSVIDGGREYVPRGVA